MTAAQPDTHAEVRNALRNLIGHGGEMVRRHGGCWRCAHCGTEFVDADDALVAGMIASGAVSATGRLSSGTPYHVEIREFLRA